MPTINKPAGLAIPRGIGEPLQTGVSKAQAEFGFGVRNPANSIREIVEAIGAMPWDAREQDIVNLAQEFDPRHNSGQFLEASLWPLFRRKQPAVAAGIVNLNYKSIVTSPDPLFSASDLEFIDGAGIRYLGTSNLSPPTSIHDTSPQTGTASEAIGSTNSRIAQKVDILDRDFPQSIRFGGLASITSAPVANFRLETDSAGNPSGVLADARLLVTAQALVAGTNDVIFEKGAKIASGDYWLIAVVSGGTITFDGGTGGAANQVKVYTGSWANSATVENLNVILFNGGQFPVVAAQLGASGNIAIDSLGSVRANNGSAQTLYDTIVDSFENLVAFEGGRDLESDESLRSRARLDAAARGTSSPGGIVEGMLDGSVDGVTFVDILENDSAFDWGQEQTLLNNSLKTGTNGDLIDGVTYLQTAQRFIVGSYSSISAIAVKLAVNNSAEMTLRVETDDGGEPSGNLASPKFEVTGVTPVATNRLLIELDRGDFLSAGTYWLVAVQTNGDFRFQGSGAGATDNVKRYTGSAWELSTVIEDMNVEIYGGVPPKSFQLFVEGGSDDNVAQGIYGLRAPGITPYGPESGIALDVANREVLQHFARPINVDTVFDIEVLITPAFAGTTDTIRNLIAEYVSELGIGDDLVRAEAQSRLLTGDSRTIGVFDVTKIRLGKKGSFPTPGSLTGTEIVNLSLSFGERFRLLTPSTDIAVTLTSV